MRDHRDAKAMAQTLRESLKTQSVDITHSAALELVARMLGFRDWQVLAARLEADRAPKPEPAQGPPPRRGTLYCSFCGKSQHDVVKLIAGPSVFICDECTGLCDDIVSEPALEGSVTALQGLAGKSTEELVVLKAKARTSLARSRQLLAAIRSIENDPGAAAGLGLSDPQRWFVVRQTPEQRAAYRAEVEERIDGIQRVAEAAATLLAERGVSLETDR